MVKKAGKLKRADRRAPSPDLKIDLPATDSTETSLTSSTPYKSYQHSTAAPLKSKNKAASSSQSLGKASRAKREKAIARADKVNSKFLTNKAKAERKKLMKS